MRVQIVSDLHLEAPKAYDIYDIVPKAPTLALLGDIGNAVPHKDLVLAFLRHQLQQFKTVLFVPGNHEAYGSSWPATLDVLRQFAEQHRDPQDELGRFVLLDRATFAPSSESADNIVVLGCSLFSHVPYEKAMAVEIGVQDFSQTDSWMVDHHNEAHRRDLAWLNAEVERIEQETQGTKVVIFTHWSPTLDARSTDPRHVNSLIGSGFATDLSKEKCCSSKNVVLWAFGHTHFNCDFEVEREDVASIRYVTNQRGYYFAQAEGFDGEMVLDL